MREAPSPYYQPRADDPLWTDADPIDGVTDRVLDRLAGGLQLDEWSDLSDLLAVTESAQIEWLTERAEHAMECLAHARRALGEARNADGDIEPNENAPRAAEQIDKAMRELEQIKEQS